MHDFEFIYFSGGVVIYFDRIEVVNILDSVEGKSIYYYLYFRETRADNTEGLQSKKNNYKRIE